MTLSILCSLLFVICVCFSFPSASATEFDLDYDLIKNTLTKNSVIIYGEILDTNEAISCASCESFASYLGPFILKNTTMAAIESITLVICEIIKPQCDNPSACKDLCTGIIKEHAIEIMTLLTETVLAPAEICYIVKLCPKPPAPSGPRPGVPVPSNLSDFTGQKQWPSWSNTQGSGYFLHMSDLHIDVLYSVGSNNNCGEPMCCRADNGLGTNSSNTAQLWGDYNCDAPHILIEDLFKYISALNPPPDFILYTGDNPPHDVWQQSRPSNLRASNVIAQLMLTHFPTIPVFNAIGNHESYPVNQFQGPGFDSWLYNMLLVDWAYWLPKDALHTLSYGGYYQALIRPGLRVISLNDNYWAADDFYLIANNTDISSQFPWLVSVLEQVRERGEKAIIIGHTRPTDWEKNFTATYQNILTDYQDCILNQFFGHTHISEITLFYPYQHTYLDSNPINIAYTGGSVTPFTDLNPGFRSYIYNRSTITEQQYLVQDIQQYWTDLALTNQINSTDWNTVRISALHDFQLNNMSPDSIQSLAMNIANNKEVYVNLLSSRYKGMIPSDPDSAESLKCDMLSSTDDLRHMCEHHHQIKQMKKPKHC